MEMIFLIVGCLLTSFGLYRMFDYFRFFKKGITIEGKVVDSFSFRNSKGIYLHAPVVEYYFKGRQRITGEIGTFSRPKRGRKMTVGINPQNLSKRRLEQNSFIFIHSVITGLGIILILLYLLVRFIKL